MSQCKAEGCDNPVHARGLCTRCYTRAKTAGEIPDAPPTYPNGVESHPTLAALAADLETIERVLSALQTPDHTRLQAMREFAARFQINNRNRIARERADRGIRYSQKTGDGHGHPLA